MATRVNCAFAALAALALVGSSEAITVVATRQGTLTNVGAGFENIGVGTISGVVFRHYLTFNVPFITEPSVSAVRLFFHAPANLHVPIALTFSGFKSDANEVFQVKLVTGSLFTTALIGTPAGAGGTAANRIAAFNNVGSSTTSGSFTFLNGSASTYPFMTIVVTLDAAGIAAVQAAQGGVLTVGGMLQDTATGGTFQYAFGSSRVLAYMEIETNCPTPSPTHTPTHSPTFTPTHTPTFTPTQEPTPAPTNVPTFCDYPAFDYTGHFGKDLISYETLASLCDGTCSTDCSTTVGSKCFIFNATTATQMLSHGSPSERCLIVPSGVTVTKNIQLSGGNDCLIVQDGGAISGNVDMGNGDDYVSVAGSAVVASVKLGGGLDFAEVDGKFSSLNGEGGADVIIVDETSGDSVVGEAGEDRILIDDSNVNNVGGGDGADIIYIIDSIVGIVHGHDGRDEILIEDSTVGEVIPAQGSDSVVIADSTVGKGNEFACNDIQHNN